MKVGLFTELFPPSLGGQEIRFREIARGLADRGHHVDVFCIAHTHGLPSQEVVDGYRIHRYPIAPNYQQPLIPALRRSPMAVMRYAWWTRRILAAERFDLVLMNQWPYLHILTAPRRALRCAAIGWCEVRGGLVYRMAQVLLPRLSHANVAVSPGVARQIADASGCRPLYLPSGIHVAAYRPGEPQGRRDLLSLGRLVEHKNLLLLVNAFTVVVQQGYPYDLIIAGDGPAEGVLRQQINASPLRSRIHLVGRVTDADKLKLLSSADLLVITSRREGFPRVIAEAMASGLPTVTVNYPENASGDVVRMYSIGYVAQPSPTGVAEAIVRALQERDVLSARCVAEAPALDWTNLLPQLESLVMERPFSRGPV